MTAKLVIFDVDGTLVDSQAQIVAAMGAAFRALGWPAPSRAAMLASVGLSLPVAMARLAPEARPAEIDGLVEAYRASSGAARHAPGGAAAPLYPGAAEALARLDGRGDVVLAVATGKSRRGLGHVLAEHGLAELFVTRQTADDHPSKPNPAMVLAALAATGVAADAAAMVGDTTFDVHMAAAAGIAAVGVNWGYHAGEELRAAGAECVLDGFEGLDTALAALWERAA